MTSQRTRERLLQRLREQGISNEAVLGAIRDVPRHLFVDEALASRAYEDTPLPIGHGQTISQPYIVARMTELLFRQTPPARVLEVGTGSGYQAAVLATLGAEIYTVERLEPLYRGARKRFRDLGYRNVHSKLSDGGWGWAEFAPYDAIIVTAAASELPASLLDQLHTPGRLIAPIGNDEQQLLLIERRPEGDTSERLELVRFVPLVRDPR